MHYQNILKPVTIRGNILKNRLMATISLPHFSQGPEQYPGEENLRHMIGRAANGAAVVTMTGVNGELGLPPFPQEADVSHFPSFDIYDTKCQNYMVQLTEAIHSYGAIASMGLVPASNTYPFFNEKGEMELVRGAAETDRKGMITLVGGADITDALSVSTLEKIAVSHAQQARQLQFLGYDMITLHMSYRSTLMARMLSPLTNKRTDEFGGDISGRARFPLMVLQTIREAVGPGFIIELHISGEEPAGGNTVEEVAWFLKQAAAFADIAQIRAGEIDPNHPTGFCPDPTPMLDVTEQIRKKEPGILISCAGGWLDPDLIENALREEKLDMVSAARAWISNPDYVELICQERADDIVPCVRCNRCHGRGDRDTFATVCTVNPVFGLERFQDTMVRPVGRKKRVAVVGGGPGGMKAAIELADRGHDVTLYEEKDILGGALRHTDYVGFKWPLRDYKNYLIRQVAKRNITVKLNTRGTEEILANENYGAVIAAIGSEPVVPEIPGMQKENRLFAIQVLEDISLAGKRVVVIGGGEVGIETGMYLAENGREVTVLEMRSEIAADATRIHYRSMMQNAWEQISRLKTVTDASVTEIRDTSVVYRDKNGKEHAIPADTIVLSCGMKPLSEQALSLYGYAKEFYMIGDCRKQGTVQTAIRNAYYVANTI